MIASTGPHRIDIEAGSSHAPGWTTLYVHNSPGGKSYVKTNKIHRSFRLLHWLQAVRDVPNVTREKMTVCPRHRFSLELAFRLQKATAKLSNDAFYAIICC
jgi:hypothetical protein